MRKYLYMYKMAVQDMFSDAGKTFIWILVGAADAFVMSFTWLVVAQGNNHVGNLSTAEVISYYFFLFITWYVIGGVFHPMISDWIHSGHMSTLLTKPMFPYAKAIVMEQGWKTFGLLSGLPILVILFLIFNQQITINFPWENIGKTLPSIVISAIIFGEIELLIGNVTYWTHSNTGIHKLSDLLYAIFGGVLAPLALMPQTLQAISNFLPYRYIFALPIDIFQGRIHGSELIYLYVAQIIWVVALFFLCRFVYYQGLKKYEAFGN